MMPLPEGISVIIACHNGADRLEPTLRHLAAQHLPDGLPWELVLVDNASTDAAAEVAQTIWNDLGAPAQLQIIREPRPGTDHARRAGAYEARYDIFAFCDDDNWLAPDYLAIGYQYLSEHSNVGIVGGQGEPVAESQLPEWFSEWAGYYAACAPAPQTADMTEWGLWSAGMMGRTELLRRALDPRSPLLNAGRVGAGAGFGEDGEICMRIAMQGYRIHYCQQMKFRHWLPEGRLNESYLGKLQAAHPAAARTVFSYLRCLRLRGMPESRKLLIYCWHALKAAMGVGRSDISSDYCYFLSGSSRYENRVNRVVRQYCELLQGN